MITQVIKSLILKLFPNKLRRIINGKYNIASKHGDGRYKALTRYKVVLSDTTELSRSQDYSRQLNRIVRRLKLRQDLRFVYPLDSHIWREVPIGKTRLASITVDFGKVLDSDLNYLARVISDNQDTDFKKTELSVIAAIEYLAGRISRELTDSDNQDLKVLSGLFPELLYRRPLTLEEALQKLLFYDALFWQMGHQHIGLGRLDLILYPYYHKDIEACRLNYGSAKQLIKDFCDTLHSNYGFKSAGLTGDTGQYILIGGTDKEGSNVDNDITAIFLELFAESPMPDPKLILRVNGSTSQHVWEKAVECILRGSGSPLLMNEEAIAPGMVKFGYEKEDLVDLGTSACWEPLIIGKSFDQNNPFRSNSALRVLNQTILNGEIFNDYNKLLSTFIDNFTKSIQNNIPMVMDFDRSPLFSLFFDSCIERGRDFADGGAKYAMHGAQVVGLPNTVNALLNIKKYVFDTKTLSYQKLRHILETDFADAEDIRLMFRASEEKFGKCSEAVISLTNQLMEVAGDAVSKIKCNDQPVKIGFSSPSYIGDARYIGASADGRHKGEPLAVHISPLSQDIDISEILQFATELNYSGNRLNGNVVDFILPSSYVKMPSKLIALLKKAVSDGLFEIQLNVLDKKTLIDAKAHPEKYPDLIVRVWGFSAYFNDLPEVYKDNLIARAS